MRIDLHLHSRFSDGTEWPAQLAARAAALGIECAALTDHDSLEGVDRFLAACHKLPIRGIAGVEFDVLQPEIRYRKELLGYYPGGEWHASQALGKRRLAARQESLSHCMGIAQKHFDRPDLSLAEMDAKRRTTVPPDLQACRYSWTRVDFYHYLRSKGVIPSAMDYYEFRDTHFGAGMVFQGETTKPTLAEAAALIRSDGGYPVLPHPGHIFGDDPARMAAAEKHFRTVLGFCTDAGVWGVELYYYGDATDGINGMVRRLAPEYGLGLTCGSDCHGPGSTKHTMEKFIEELAEAPWE